MNHWDQIQYFIIYEEWDNLIEYLTTNEISLEDLNSSYTYTDKEEHGGIHYLPMNAKLISYDAPLLTIAAYNHKIELVELLLEYGCKLRLPKLHSPLEILFIDLFAPNIVKDYSQQEMLEKKFLLFELLLFHAIDKKIRINEVPFPSEISCSFIKSLIPSATNVDKGNIYHSSYLQILCSIDLSMTRNELDHSNDKEHLTEEENLFATPQQVMQTINTYIQAGADIYYKDKSGKTVIDYTCDMELLGFLLKKAGFDKDFLKEHIMKYKNKYIKEKQPEIKIQLKQKIDILCEFLLDKSPACKLIEQLLSINPSGELIATFSKYLRVQDIRSLRLTCKAFNEGDTTPEPQSYTERVKTKHNNSLGNCILM